MSSQALGSDTSEVEVTHISSHGVWLLAGGEELFMPFDEFPWFQEAAVREILNVEQPMPGHFHWPDLDVDLTAEMIRQPDQFPLKAR